MFKEILNIIIPICLKVDNAIIFFKSFSKLAANPDINIVIDEINNKKFIKKDLKAKLNRINK